MPNEADASWWHGTYEERMERRALRRASPEFKERINAIRAAAATPRDLVGDPRGRKDCSIGSMKAMLWIIYGGQSLRAHAIADATAVETMCGKAIGVNPKEVKGLSDNRKCKVCQSVVAANQPWPEAKS